MTRAWVPTVAEPHDAAAVIALWQTCGLTRPWNDPATDFALAVREPQSDVLVLYEADMLCGSVMVGFDGHRGWVYYLAVAYERRHAGIGRALMAAAEEWLRLRSAPKVQLMVRGDNAAAVGFYEALGLARQDVVVFGRVLDGGALT